MSESDDVLSIDLEDPDDLKDFNSIFIGAMTKEYEGTVTSLEPLTTIDISLSAWKSPSYVKHRAMLMQRFPRVITNINALESEFLEYQTTPDVEFLAYFDEDNKLRRIDHIWHQIS